jgi:hypothetical protein
MSRGVARSRVNRAYLRGNAGVGWGDAAQQRGAARAFAGANVRETPRMEIFAACRGVLTSAQTAGAKLFRIQKQ